jgi:hypothetical protein
MPMANQYLKKCSSPLINRDANQNHSEILPHPRNNDNYQKDERKQVRVRMWRKDNLAHCLWEQELVQPLWKASMDIHQNLKTRLACDPKLSLGNEISIERHRL